MSKIKFEYNGFELDICYDSQPADITVGFKGQFDIEEIHYNGMDLTYLLEPQLTDIENAFLKHFNELKNDNI